MWPATEEPPLLMLIETSQWQLLGHVPSERKSLQPL